MRHCCKVKSHDQGSSVGPESIAHQLKLHKWEHLRAGKHSGWQCDFLNLLLICFAIILRYSPLTKDMRKGYKKLSTLISRTVSAGSFLVSCNLKMFLGKNADLTEDCFQQNTVRVWCSQLICSLERIGMLYSFHWITLHSNTYTDNTYMHINIDSSLSHFAKIDMHINLCQLGWATFCCNINCQVCQHTCVWVALFLCHISYLINENVMTDSV